MPMTPKCPWCGVTYTAEHASECDALHAERIVTLALDTGAVLGDREEKDAKSEKVIP